MKRFAVLFLSIFVILSACAQGGEETNSATSEGHSEPVQEPDRDLVAEGLPAFNEEVASLPETTLDVWLATDYAEEAPIQDAIAEFSEVYPHIKVNTRGIEWGEMINQIRLAVTGGSPPDMAHQHAFAMGAQGLAEPVDDLWEKWGEEETFVPGAIEDVVWKGKKYGVPLDINTTFYLYNKKLFEENGIGEPPNTMDELLEVSRKLTADDGSRYGFVNSASAWNLYGHVVAEGGELLIEEGDTPQVNLDGPIVKEVVKKYTELSTVHEVAPIPPAQQRQTDHPVAMFGTGRAASFVSGPFDLSRIENEFPDVYEDVGTAVIPGPEKGSTMGGGSLFVPKGSENKVAAFELMKWFISDKYAIRLAEEMGRHPVKTHLYENELYQDPLLQPFIETLQYAKPYKLEAYPEANDAWSQAIRDIFNGADVENTLDQAQKTAEQAIDKSSH